MTLQVTDSDGNITYKVIALEGEGTLPRLYFDKRELILPIVPLGFESSIVFKVKNDGYENEEIKYYFESYPQGLLPLKLIWLDKSQTIGYLKTELRCEVKFEYNKPITFTTKLVFCDTDGQQFPIQVAGTCDNCLFTNYSFIQRHDPDAFEFCLDKDSNTISLKPKPKKDDSEIIDAPEDKKSEKSSFQGSSMTKNSAVLGYGRIVIQV